MSSRAIPRHPFHAIAVAALAAVIVVAFARSYYLKILFGLPPLTQAAHIHGILSSLWLVLHFTQARLIATHRVVLHRRLGILTACVGFILAIQAYSLSIAGVAAGHAPPGRDPLQFLSVPTGTTTMFLLFLVAALALRRRREWHKRLMLFATMALLVPAAGRLDSLIMVPLGLPRALIAFWLTFAFVAWAWIDDWRRSRRIHPANLIGGITLLVSLPARRLLGFTDAWLPIAQWLTGQ